MSEMESNSGIQEKGSQAQQSATILDSTQPAVGAAFESISSSFRFAREFTIDRLLSVYARQQKMAFIINGEERPSVLVFSEMAFLPVVAMVADLDARELLGMSAGDLGIEFTEMPDALFGASVSVKPLTNDVESVFRGLIFFEAARKVFGMHEQSEVDCLEIYEAYASGEFLYWLEQRVAQRQEQINSKPHAGAAFAGVSA